MIHSIEDDVEALDAVTIERVIVNTSTGPIQRNMYAPIPETNTTNTVEDDRGPPIVMGETDHTYNISDHGQDDYGESAGIAVPADQPASKITLRSLSSELVASWELYSLERLSRRRTVLNVLTGWADGGVKIVYFQPCYVRSYFRAAALWEVGVYILIQHHTGERICDTLKFQQHALEDMQYYKDNLDEDICREVQGASRPFQPASETNCDCSFNSINQSLEHDQSVDEHVFADMDWLYVARQEGKMAKMGNGLYNTHNDCILQDDDEDEDSNIDHPPVGFTEYLEGTPAAPVCGMATASSTAWVENQSDAPMRTPRADGLNNQYLRIAHVNGIHHLAVITCACQGDDQIPIDLMYSRLVPTSFTRMNTLFTTMVLDMFWLANLELKASAYQYFHLLHRLTAKTATHVPNLYHDLRKVSRAWRWMKKLKWAGFGHTMADPAAPAAGQLSNFCPACPQPEINLPADWKDDPNRNSNRWVFRRFFVADGNFKADHIRQKNDAADVWLSEGGGMMPQHHNYQDFLDTAIERRTKAPCENQFRVIEQAMLFSKACDITGIVAVACAQHGCFAPNSIVNLFQGEQQKNIDYSFLQALKTTNVNPAQGTMLIYDIACQHKDDCFFCYAPSFIPGTGVVAGKILESLWAGMNTITPAMRTATLAHRAEMTDDHGSDSNHKKLLAMTVDTMHEAKEYYTLLSAPLEKGDIDERETEIKRAKTDRLHNPAAMDVMVSQQVSSDQNCSAESPDIQNVAGADWIVLGLGMEETDRIKHLEKEPQEAERDDVGCQRHLLAAEFEVLELAQRHAAATPGALHVYHDEPETFADLDEEIVSVPTTNPHNVSTNLPSPAAEAIERVCPERRPIPIPSICLSKEHLLSKLELILRQQQANRYIKALQEVIVDKSFQFSHVIPNAPRKSVITHARDTITKLNHKIALYAKVYGRCRAALLRLSADDKILKVFQPLKRSAVASSCAIRDPNVPGSTSLWLLWIWHMSTADERYKSLFVLL
ncbi:hypothetical protein BYT27DRAFT_7259306 [Phlegmacium glaucopus]|nr:hypothetical protein BYT27DRAFT_7259306 [Phlegmacium glaucopus]